MKQFLNFKQPINLKENDWSKFNTLSLVNKYDNEMICEENVLIPESGLVYKNFKDLKYSYPYPYHIFITNSQKNLKYMLRKFVNFLKLKYYISYRIDKNYLIITDYWSNNYFHWFSEALPRLLNAQAIKNDVSIILLPLSYEKKNFVIESLDLLNIPYEFTEKKVNLYVKKILFAPHLITSGHHIPKIMKQLKKELIKKDTQSRYKIRRMYISRQNATLRNILNEEELFPILKKYHFEVVKMENYSWQEQVLMMKDVEYLVGPHGAGLTNMLFSTNKLSILELLPQRRNKTINNCYYSLSSSLDYNYYYQFAERQILSSKLDDGGDSNFFINIDAFESNIRMMLKNNEK